MKSDGMGSGAIAGFATAVGPDDFEDAAQPSRVEVVRREAR